MAFAIAPPATETDATLTVGPVGTRPYMAPEQHRDGKQANVRSDVWGLGVTLYELLTLQRAFATGEAVLKTEPIPPRQLNPGLDRDLEAVVLKALRKDPAHRYPTAQALADDLRHWLGREPVTAREAHTLRRLGLWAKRNKGWATAIAAAAADDPAAGHGGIALGNKIAATAAAEAESAQVKQENAEAEARHEGELRVAAEQREQIRKREVLIQEIQRIRIIPHNSGWRKLIESRIIEAKGLGGDDNSLRTQAIASLRELDAYREQGPPLPRLASGLRSSGRRLYSCWFQDQVIRVWDRETDETRTLTLKGDGPFAFRLDGTPWQLAQVGKDGRTLVLQDLARETVLRRFTSPRQDRPFFADFAITPSGSHVAALAGEQTQGGIGPARERTSSC